MAEAKEARTYSYPSMGVRQWFALRERFKRSVPQVVDADYLASALDMTPQSARNNIIPSLKATGIVDEANKPQEIAFKWRDDKQYKEACEQIRSNVYPSSLVDLNPPESVNAEEVKRWFAHSGKVGDSAAKKMAAFYVMLCKADPAASGQGGATQPKAKGAKAITTAKPAAKTKPKIQVHADPDEIDDSNKHRQPSDHRHPARTPSLALNLQVLISPDASPEQIDKIFESMAKHLKGFA